MPVVSQSHSFTSTNSLQQQQRENNNNSPTKLSSNRSGPRLSGVSGISGNSSGKSVGVKSNKSLSNISGIPQPVTTQGNTNSNQVTVTVTPNTSTSKLSQQPQNQIHHHAVGQIPVNNSNTSTNSLQSLPPKVISPPKTIAPIADPPVNSTSAQKLKLPFLKFILSVGGILNCTAMVGMAIFILIEIDSTDFFSICYSISQSMLFGVTGFSVLVFESSAIFNPYKSSSASGSQKNQMASDSHSLENNNSKNTNSISINKGLDSLSNTSSVNTINSNTVNTGNPPNSFKSGPNTRLPAPFSNIFRFWSKHSRFVANKLGLVIFYFWIGSLIMGGRNYVSKTQKTMGRTVGVVSWVLSILNLLTACAVDRDSLLEKPLLGLDFCAGGNFEGPYNNNNMGYYGQYGQYGSYNGHGSYGHGHGSYGLGYNSNNKYSTGQGNGGGPSNVNGVASGPTKNQIQNNSDYAAGPQSVVGKSLDHGPPTGLESESLRRSRF